MPNEIFWNMSTSVRNPERLSGFLQVAALLDGATWDKACQERFQIMLIQHRKYLSETEDALTFRNLSAEQISWLKDKTLDMTYEQAESIFRAKDYKDPAMRGRQSINPLQKLGLVYIVDRKVILSDVGRKLADGTITWDDFILDSMLKYQLPNPITQGYRDWNTKPFISTLRLIKRVNEMCEERGQKVKGISKEEFGIFALSLKNYTDVDAAAAELLNYRNGFEGIRQADFRNYRECETVRKAYTEDYITQFLADFDNALENSREYGDSMMRYLRQTKYIRIIGKYAHQYIDLEPRRMIEIDAILQNDDGSAKEYTADEWIEYMGTYGAYELPFDTMPSLTNIFNAIVVDIRALEQKLGIAEKSLTVPADKVVLKAAIESAREYRTELQNLEIKFDYSRDTSKIDEAITTLGDIAASRKENFANKLPLELEKWVNVALNIINDADSIKLNASVGDDNEPTSTAPAGVPDIECHYGTFGVICEVTMLRSRDQWYNEGQPVMRHLRDFETKNNTVPNYCLFVAPSLHEDTLETYWTSVRHGYKGERQKIVPLTIAQLSKILSVVKQMKESGRSMRRDSIMALYDLCTDLSSVNNSGDWSTFIDRQMNSWKNELLVVV
ncbi:MAG: AlwI family type II restriction endonuclease [Lactobacillaceae bacterium]|jgi:hypothetical protein|nr:AlwI family type II restriction endonuclease [Lactobacillaceae bacterium]